MKRFVILSAIGTAMLLIVLPSWASISLNSSRSNVYRMVNPKDLVSQAQATAMLNELDKLGPVDETKLKQWLTANFKRFGIDGNRVKKMEFFLEQQISCTMVTETGSMASYRSAAPCNGKIVGPSNLGAGKTNSTGNGDISIKSTAATGVCSCFEPITSPAQVQRVNKIDRIETIFLLSDPAQEGDAFAIAVSDPGTPNKKN